jgi:hypothetical protein
MTSETLRVTQSVTESVVELLSVHNHLLEGALTLVNKLVKLAELSVFHLAVEPCLLPFTV